MYFYMYYISFANIYFCRFSSSDERSNNIVHDNMAALATRIDNWSVADAARFLMVTMPSGHRGSTGLTRHMIERHFSRTHPMFLYAAVMGGPATIPPGVSSMGSYEVHGCVCLVWVHGCVCLVWGT